MYLPLIAERWSPRRMIFLAAVVPRPGVSIIEQYQADPSMFNPAWVGQNPLEDRVALDFVYHDCPPERLDWALSTRLVFYAKRALEEPCPLRSCPLSRPLTSFVPTTGRSRQHDSARPLESCSEWNRLSCTADTAHMSAVLKRSPTFWSGSHQRSDCKMAD